ncbi:MAG: transcription antitermination factor NusB [Chlorobiales bacterium]|jgi:transcription antitermination protein NusB|nr:transcription antitermination factor NusB [Chlorobiales bacterium]
MVISRRHVRESVMQVLYAFEMRKEDIEKVAQGVLPDDLLTDIKAKDFAFKIINSILSNRDQIDAFIERHADNWELSRMAIIDKNLMRIAIAEMLFLDDVPPKVSINEAIEIAKKFSTDKSSKFVNGILDATYNEIRAAGVLQKSGRGLVDMPAKQERVIPAPQPKQAVQLNPKQPDISGTDLAQSKKAQKPNKPLPSGQNRQK